MGTLKKSSLAALLVLFACMAWAADPPCPFSPDDVNCTKPTGPVAEDYNPADLCQSYLADSGSSAGLGSTETFSFINPGSFTLILHDAYSDTGYAYQVVVQDVPMTQSYTINGTLGSGSPDWPSTSLYQTRRLYRSGVASTCAAPRACPGFPYAGNYSTDRYDFSEIFAAGACVQVSVYNANYTFLHGVAYGLGYLFFHDQYDRSELCLNTATGDYVYNILSGPHMGESFTGVATIVNYGPTYFLFKSACPYGSPYCLMGNWDSNRLKAAASLRVNSPTRYYSNLYDPNYADSPECGGGAAVTP